ncbi:MAG: hypothetical protein ACOX2O_08505 [Bdellovibrionota bacterium]|jgi:hypothetical protein
MSKIFYIFTTIIFTLCTTVPTFAEESTKDDSPFLPAWRLLNNNDKQQFVSGYQQGWKDAVKIIDIVIGYLKTNPAEGAKALEQIRNIYNLSTIKTHTLVHEIDLFYANPQNNTAPLSKAVTAAKTKLQ